MVDQSIAVSACVCCGTVVHSYDSLAIKNWLSEGVLQQLLILGQTSTLPAVRVEALNALSKSGKFFSDLLISSWNGLLPVLMRGFRDSQSNVSFACSFLWICIVAGFRGHSLETTISISVCLLSVSCLCRCAPKPSKSWKSY